MKRYEIRWVSLDPTLGREMTKTRPAVIVSLDVLNRTQETVVVCPLTTSLHPAWRTRCPYDAADARPRSRSIRSGR